MSKQGSAVSRALALTSFGVMLVATACGVDALNLAGHACPCTTGFVCDATKNVCVQVSALVTDAGPSACQGDNCSCTTAADCKDPDYPACADGKCVECVSQPADSCPLATYCTRSHTCAPGCKNDKECANLSATSPFCNVARHQCVNCLNDTDCKGTGEKCSPSGACAVACTGGACPDNKQCCGGLCIDTKSDPLNCNACGTQCTGATNACCGGACVDTLGSAANCGKCGTVCGTLNGTPSCFGGVCKWSCAPGFSHCSTTDNDGCETATSSEVTKCGSCKRNCNFSTYKANGIACVNSQCTYSTCIAPYKDCDGNKSNGCECTSTTCGADGQPCCAGGQCNFGDIECGLDGRCHGG